MQRSEIEWWYSQYWAQTWYRNTFLVRRASQIAQTTDSDAEWNNVYDAGCNFTCLAMIIGIDPAYLASVLSQQRFFYADNALKGRRLSGKQGGFVWDQNAPNSNRRSITIHALWHPALHSRVSVTLRYIDCVATRNYKEGIAIVRAIRASSGHIVCGTQEHSHLVSGMRNPDYVLWDPDDTVVDVETNLAGRFTLRQLFRQYEGEAVEFWHYECEVSRESLR
jgi:hypothetical protein